MNSRQYRNVKRQGPYGAGPRFQRAQSRVHFATATQQRPMPHDDETVPQLGTHPAMRGSMNEPLGMGGNRGATSAGLSGPQYTRMLDGQDEDVGYEDERWAEILNGLSQLLDRNDGKAAYEQETIRLLRQISEQLSNIPEQLTRMNASLSQQLVQCNMTTTEHITQESAKTRLKFTDLAQKLDVWAGQLQGLHPPWDNPNSLEQL